MILANANKIPVVIPTFAAFSTICKIILCLLPPNAIPASLNSFGTSESMLSVVEMMIGIIMIESATEPAQPL